MFQGSHGLNFFGIFYSFFFWFLHDMMNDLFLFLRAKIVVICNQLLLAEAHICIVEEK